MILTEYDEKKVMENLKKESYAEGKAEGKAEERELSNNLILKLISLNRIDDLKRLASDSAYRDKMIKEFFPDK